MNVNLTPELEKLICEKVASGLYNNQSDVVRESLRLLTQQDRRREAHLERLRTALHVGLDQADREELIDGSEVVAEMREFLRERAAAAKKR